MAMSCNVLYIPFIVYLNVNPIIPCQNVRDCLLKDGFEGPINIEEERLKGKEGMKSGLSDYGHEEN